MIYSVNFQEIAGSINPLELCKYLNDLGWAELEKIKIKDIKVFQLLLKDELYQVNVPISREYRDFAKTILETCDTIAKTQGKSLEQTILELLNPLSDIIRVRIANDSIKNGSILFEDAINLYENAKKLLTTTAMSMYSNQEDFHGKLPDVVQNFIDRCRYGQTEIGSYVVSVVCPFIKEAEEGPIQLSLFDEQSDSANSITRLITKKLITDLKNVKRVVDSGRNLDELIQSRDSDKINVNFLDALKNLNIATPQSMVEISAKWAPTIRENAIADPIVSFNHDYYEVFRSKVEKYRKKTKEKAVEVLGQVSIMGSSPIPEERDYGDITLVALYKEKMRKIKIRLNVEDYYSAMKAHKRGSFVKISGEFDEKNPKLLICKTYEEL